METDLDTYKLIERGFDKRKINEIDEDMFLILFETLFPASKIDKFSEENRILIKSLHTKELIEIVYGGFDFDSKLDILSRTIQMSKEFFECSPKRCRRKFW